MSSVEIYAHRGASGQALENTWPAFELAHQLGVGIELDIQLTQDGIAVIYHDEHLRRLAGSKMVISATPYHIVESIAVGKRFNRFDNHCIPLACEVLEWATTQQIPLNIELKPSIRSHPSGPEIIADLLSGVENYHLSSFDITLLERVKALRPDIEVAWIIKKAHQWEELMDKKWVDSIHFHKRFHRAKWLEPVVALNKSVRLYGISGNERLLQSLHPSVKGLITDYPERLL